MPGSRPSRVSTSLWQTPHACTRIRTCPAPGCGTSRSTSSKSAPGLGTCTAIIVAIACFLLVPDRPEPPRVLRPEGVGHRVSFVGAAGLQQPGERQPAPIDRLQLHVGDLEEAAVVGRLPVVEPD